MLYDFTIRNQRFATATLAVFVAVLVSSVPAIVLAKNNEIHYQSVESALGAAVIVVDHSPGGDTRYTCDSDSGKCKKIKSIAAIKPKIAGGADYLTSSQGHYGVREQSFPTGGQIMTLFTLFDISGSKPKSVGEFSTSGNIVKKMFSPDEKTLVVVADNGTVTSYDLPSKATRSITILQADLPFFNVSYAGTYVSAYNYTNNAHRIWNTKTGALSEIAGTPSYVEFSASENEAALLIDNNGFKNLSVANGFGNSSVSLTPVAHGNFLVEDYLYVDDTLYYLSNKASPLSWNIYTPGDTVPLAKNASYGDFLKRAGGKLAYIKIEGKNANVYLYDKKSGKHVRLSAAPSSSAASGITRNEVTIADRTAALLSPQKTIGKSEKTKNKKKETSRNLFVWLHGGPQRQTSLGYHPYLSYAVYDELLEKLATGGNYVLKLDYSGSWGYGQSFLEKLDEHVGVVEIADVKNAIEEFKKTHTVDRVYLIGNSYGGYMAFRAVNEIPEMIGGIVSINGVADWQGLITAIPSSPFRELFDGLPDAHNMPLYINASVFTNTDAIESDTPLVVLYSTNDTTVPNKQSIQYDTFMRAQGKNTTLVPLAGENHVLKKRSTLSKLCDTVAEKLSLGKSLCTQ